MKTFLTFIFVGITVIAMAACPGGQTPATEDPPTPPSPLTLCSLAEPGTLGVNLQDPGGSGTYMFGPSEFTFDVGETVTFALCAESEFHTFTVDELGIDVSVDVGSSERLVFTFDQSGTFQLICVPHEALGMTGTITVQ